MAMLCSQDLIKTWSDIRLHLPRKYNYWPAKEFMNINASFYQSVFFLTGTTVVSETQVIIMILEPISTLHTQVYDITLVY